MKKKGKKALLPLIQKFIISDNAHQDHMLEERVFDPFTLRDIHDAFEGEIIIYFPSMSLNRKLNILEIITYEDVFQGTSIDSLKKIYFEEIITKIQAKDEKLISFLRQETFCSFLPEKEAEGVKRECLEAFLNTTQPRIDWILDYIYLADISLYSKALVEQIGTLICADRRFKEADYYLDYFSCFIDELSFFGILTLTNPTSKKFLTLLFTLDDHYFLRQHISGVIAATINKLNESSTTMLTFLLEHLTSCPTYPDTSVELFTGMIKKLSHNRFFISEYNTPQFEASLQKYLSKILRNLEKMDFEWRYDILEILTKLAESLPGTPLLETVREDVLATVDFYSKKLPLEKNSLATRVRTLLKPA